MKKNRNKDIAAAKHAAWLLMKEAGLLRNGRYPTGEVIDSIGSKAEHNKNLCRKKDHYEE